MPESKGWKEQAGEYAVKEGKKYAKKIFDDCNKSGEARSKCLAEAQKYWMQFGRASQKGLDWLIGRDPKTGKVNCRTKGGWYKWWNPYCAGKSVGLGDMGGFAGHEFHPHHQEISRPDLWLINRGLAHDSMKWEGR